MQQKKVYIIGAGGFGKEVRSMFAATGYSLAGFADDDTSREGVILPIKDIKADRDKDAGWIIAIGSSEVRERVFKRLPAGLHFSSIIHPSVIIQQASTVAYGRGTIICAGSIFTCNITMGEFCLINLNCTIGHDVRMGHFCSLMPSVNLSGNVTLDDGVFIGTGATILPGIHIGARSIVGAGSVVTKDVPPDTTVMGVPAVAREDRSSSVPNRQS